MFTIRIMNVFIIPESSLMPLDTYSLPPYSPHPSPASHP